MEDTRAAATEYRLARWMGLCRERIESGQDIKTFCEARGIRPNAYYYWQRKLREAAMAAPAGWALALA